MPITARHELRFLGHRNISGMDDRVLRRAAERGVLIRVRRGVYVDAGVWRQLTPDERDRLTVAAALDASRSPLIASHRSAAAVWRIPSIAPRQNVVDVRTSRAAGSRTEHGFRKHAVDDPLLHVSEVDGLACTTLERTVVDLALSVPFAEAVVAADWALRRSTSHAWTTRDALARTLDELAPTARRGRAEAVIAFAEPRSDSAGESLSRAVIHELGFPAPELQVPFFDRQGLIGIVDFYWADFELIGEFDGRVKYEDRAMLRGRTAGEAVVDEKRREDRLRHTGPRVLRWTWRDAYQRTPLGEMLVTAGLRPTAGRRSATPA